MRSLLFSPLTGLGSLAYVRTCVESDHQPCTAQIDALSSFFATASSSLSDCTKCCTGSRAGAYKLRLSPCHADSIHILVSLITPTTLHHVGIIRGNFEPKGRYKRHLLGNDWQCLLLLHRPAFRYSKGPHANESWCLLRHFPDGYQDI